MEKNEIGDALDRTVRSLQSGVRRLGIEAALPVIEGWEEKLAAMDSPELAAVRNDLTALRTHLCRQTTSTRSPWDSFC